MGNRKNLSEDERNPSGDEVNSSDDETNPLENERNSSEETKPSGDEWSPSEVGTFPVPIEVDLLAYSGLNYLLSRAVTSLECSDERDLGFWASFTIMGCQETWDPGRLFKNVLKRASGRSSSLTVTR
jgi:hypothetical protein